MVGRHRIFFKPQKVGGCFVGFFVGCGTPIEPKQSLLLIDTRLIGTPAVNKDANQLNVWIIEFLGEIPSVGKEFEFGDYNIKILKSTVKKVLQILAVHK